MRAQLLQGPPGGSSGGGGGGTSGPTYHLTGAIDGGPVNGSTGLTQAAVEGSPFAVDQAILVPEAGTYDAELVGRAFMLSGSTTITGRKYSGSTWSDAFAPLLLETSGGRHVVTGTVTFSSGDLFALNAESTNGFYNLVYELKLTKG